MHASFMQLACKIKIDESCDVITTEPANGLQGGNIHYRAATANTKAFTSYCEHSHWAKIVGVTVAADVVRLRRESQTRRESDSVLVHKHGCDRGNLIASHVCT